MPINISYKYQIQGAEDVKNRIKEINAEYQRGEISVQKYGKELREGMSIDHFKELLKNPEFSHYFSYMLFLEISSKITARVNYDNIDKIKRIKQAAKKNQLN